MLTQLLAGLLFFTALVLGVGQGCSKVDLQPFTEKKLDVTKPEGELCVPPPKEIGKYSKILFIIDVSGSNVSGNNGDPSDPQKARRLGAMETFFNLNRQDPFIEWGLSIFGGDVPGASRHLVQKQEPGFDKTRNFGKPEDFNQALNIFRNNADNNGTPYEAALNVAKNALETELDWAKFKNEDISSFHFVFISDGRPAPFGPDVDRSIYQLVQTMVKMSEGRLKLSTVYYNVTGPDPDAIYRLEEMARLGNGRFQDASRGEAINIQDLIVGGISHENYYIKDFFAYNLNSTICDDGNMGPDSDGDGLCDEDELEYNKTIDAKTQDSPLYRNLKFNPQSRHSFDHRFSDLFMYKHLVEKESLVSCDLVSENFEDEDQDLLNRCEERFLTAKNPQGPSLGWTQDMINMGSFASRTNFDTDGDGLLDSLEFFFFKNKGFPLNYNTINERFNRRTYYDFFIQHQSYQRPESSPPYNLIVKWIRRNEAGLHCYHVEQENLPIYPVLKYSASEEITKSPLPRLNFNKPIKTNLDHKENENVILVYYLVTTQNDPGGRGLMRYSFQKRTLLTPDEKIYYNDIPFEEIKAQ
jgi:hypothetical protein